MRIKSILLSVLFAFSFFSCGEDSGIQDLFDADKTAKGLKQALTIGAENAVEVLGKPDGYLKDLAVKILVPEEAQTTFRAIDAIASNQAVHALITAAGINIGQDLKNTLETAFNRAAEEAAPSAVNIFTSAITSMTITDAKNILFSSNNEAATDYLNSKTYSNLQTAFNPVINESMENVKVSIGSSSYNTLQAWEFFAEQNNMLANTISDKTVQTAINLANTLGALSDTDVNTINSVKEVDKDLGNYVVGKALDGIFTKVGIEEHKIRTDISARTTDLLKDVFGQLDN